jgi:DNA polymerase (family 10)
VPWRTRAHPRGEREIDGITILAGIEVDILADGRLTWRKRRSPRSTSSSRRCTRPSTRARGDDGAGAHAMACPFVDAIGHPTGPQDPAPRAAPDRRRGADRGGRLYGIALEINSNYHRLDLSDVHARRARAQGVGHLIDSDAHSTTELGLLRWGVLTARRAVAETGRRLEHARRRRVPQRPAAPSLARSGEDGTGAVTVDETWPA